MTSWRLGGGPGQRGGSRAGDCDFPVDPGLEASAVEVFWRPELDLGLVLVAPSPLQAERPLALDRGVAARSGETGRWWVEGRGRGKTRLAMLAAPAEAASGPLAAVLPLDATLPARLAALSRLWRGLGGGVPSSDDAVTPQRRARMKAMLRALDGRIDGAAYREIAIALYGAARVAATPWKSSALRDTTLRLVRDGRTMANGGYQTLLRGGRASA